MIGEGLDILIIEDDEDDYFLTYEALLDISTSFESNWARDGAEAVDYLYKKDLDSENRLPDLILLDINMPKKNGIETLREIRSNSKFDDVSIVVLSSSINPNEIKKELSLQNVSFVEKTSDLRDFREFFRDLVDRRILR